MTIAATATSVQYVLNGTTTQFSFPNKIFSAADLIVTDLSTSTPPAETVLTLNTNYTVANVDVDTGCYITLMSPGVSGHTLDIRTRIAETQSTSVKNQGAFYPELHEEAFDRLTRMIQDLLRLAYTFGIHGPDIETTPWTPLPIASSRANCQLLFDVNGLPTVGQATSQTINSNNVGLALYPQTPAEIAASVNPVNFGYIPHEARREGATGNASTDDSGAIANATKVAQEGLYDIPMSSYLVGGGFKVANTVTTSYAGQGQINFKGAKIHGPAVVYPTVATYVFEMDADTLGQQEAKFKLEDLMVSGDGTHYPSFMRTSWIYFSEANSINSFNGGPVIDWQYGGQNTSRSCTAFGGTGQVGFNVYRCHDSYVTEFHAYGCATGVQAMGLNSAGQDGNVNFVNGASHGNSAYGYFIKGLYTPTLINIVAEVQPVNVHIESCQYGLMWGAFLGPASGGLNYSIHYAWNTGSGNDFNIVGAVNAQNEMRYENCQSGVIADSIVAGVPSSNSGGAISFNASALMILNGLMVRNNPGFYSYIQDSTSNSMIINGGRYEQQIYLQGTKAARSGNIIMPNYLLGGIKTDDATQGQFALTEYARFFDGTRINETSWGYLLPYLVQSGTLGAGGTATFDTSTILPVPAGAVNSSEGEFMISGGLSGSISASKVLAVRGFNATTATILATNGALGSFTVTVSGSVITVTNPSGTGGASYAIRMVKLASY